MTAEADPVLAPTLPSTEERIIDSARRCFEEVGVDRIRMEEVAARAGVSRQTIYKYFASKSDIVDRIAHLEMMKVNALLRRRVPGHKPFAERLTEAILLSVEISRDNPYLMRTVADVTLMPRYSDKSGELFQWQRRQWSSMIDRARRAGDLAEDLDTDQVVRWIMLSQLLLLMMFERLSLGDVASRAFIRRFMVEPLIAHGDGAATDLEAELEALRAQNLALKDLVATQALALNAWEKGAPGK